METTSPLQPISANVLQTSSDLSSFSSYNIEKKNEKENKTVIEENIRLAKELNHNHSTHFIGNMGKITL